MSNTEDIELEARIEPNGDLTLLANQATRDHLTELEDDTDFSNAMFDLFERWSRNGSYTLFDAAQGNPFVGLTSAAMARCAVRSRRRSDGSGPATRVRKR